MVEDNAKHHWFRVATVALVTFIMSFLAFYIVMELLYNRIAEDAFGFRKFDKILQQEQRDFRRFEDKMMDNPFIPKTRPMIVNLVKENDEYKIIVDLTSFDGDENNINVSAENKVLTISGEIDNNLLETKELLILLNLIILTSIWWWIKWPKRKKEISILLQFLMMINVLCNGNKDDWGEAFRLRPNLFLLINK